MAGRSRLWVEVDNLRAAVFWGLDATREEDGALALRTIAALVGVGSTWGWVGFGSWAQQALGRAEGEDARYRSLILAAASHSAYFRGEFALARRLAGDAGRLGVVPGCPVPAIALIPAFMYARAEDLPDLLTTALAELDRVGATAWDFALATDRRRRPSLRSSAISPWPKRRQAPSWRSADGWVPQRTSQRLSTPTAWRGGRPTPTTCRPALQEGLSTLRNNETLGSRTLALVA